MRALGVGLWLVGAAAGALAQLAPAPDPVGADATFIEVADVRVHGEGAGTLSEAQVRALEVELSRVAGGWVAPRRELPRERVRLGELGAEPLRLYGSALESIEDALARAHALAGRPGVSVELRPGAVRFERDGVERRNLVVELRELGAPPAPAPAEVAVPAAPDRFGADAVLVTVRSLALDGLRGLGISEEELLATAVELSWDGERIPAGFIAARPGLRRQSVQLWQLGRFSQSGAQLYGSAVQAILDELGQTLYARGVYGVTVDLAPGAVRRLSTPGSDGLLVLRVAKD
jgi:hypothetical protein